MIKWNDYFDQIYCIHYLPKHAERYDRIYSQLKKIGIIDSGIFRWKFTFNSPIYEIIQKNSVHHHNATRDSINMFKCMLAHYEIIKDANEFNYNRILILEEDVVFNKDINMIEKTLANMPNYDIVMLDKFCYNGIGFNNEMNNPTYKINDYYRMFDSTCIAYGSGACYSLNKFAIQKFVEIYEDGWQCPDGIWNEKVSNCMTKCYAINNIAIQKSFSSCNSSKFNMDLAYNFAQVNVDNYEV